MNGAIGLPFAMLAALLLLVVAIFGARAWTRRAGRSTSGRRASARSPLVRLLCAVSAIVILVAVAVSSWREAHAPYRDIAAQPSAMVKAPAQPRQLARLRLAALPGAHRPLTSARFLVHVFIGPLTPAGFIARYHRDWDARWPSPDAVECAGSWDAAGSQVDFRFTLREPMDAEVDDLAGATRRVLVMNSTFRCEYHSGSSSCSSSGTGFLSEAGQCIDFGSPGRAHSGPLSVAARPDEHLILFAVLTPLAEDEALIEQPLAGFLASYQERLLTGNTFQYLGNGPGDLDDIPMRGLALAAHLGLVTLPLLLAALLLAQCFRRRSLALVGALFGVVLFTAVLDRLLVGVHLGRLDDPQGDIDQRLLAGSCLRGSFFHRATALRHVHAIVADPQAPPLLRGGLGEVERILAGREPR